ncbi:MAG TPA: hypothetical protein VHA52_02390 [Candidatus Babeliaceae bacterium]|nr:hypothetical protein [Candidatus Babeliaceae bacterium]
MPRNTKNLGTKVAWKILGKPQNMQPQDDKFKERVDARLAYEDTRFVR